MAIEHVNDENFTNKISDGVVLVDFWAPWCGPCKMIAPVLEEIDLEMSDKLKIVKLNTDENEQITRQFGIMSIPTLIVFKDGEIADKMIGLLPKEALVERLNQQL